MISEVFVFTLGLLFDDKFKSIPVGRSGLPNFGPKPLVHPFGPGYSMHPELSRSGIAVLASRAFLPVAVITSFVSATYGEAIASEIIAENENVSFVDKAVMLQGLTPY